MARTTFAVLAVGLLVASPAAAQLPGAPSKMLQVGIGGGASVPVGHAENALKEGFNVHGFVKVKPPMFPVALRGGLGYHRFNLDQVPAGTDGTGSILSGLGGITVGKSVGPIRPYITASLGAFRIERKLDANGVESKGHETKFGIDGGAGLEFKVMSLNGFVEARLENVYTNQGFDPSLADKNSTRIVPVTFGLMF